MLSLVSIIYAKVVSPELFPWRSNALPWHLEYIFIAMFFMVLGYFFKKRYENVFDKYNTATHRRGCWIIYLLLVYIPFFSGIRFPMVIDIFYQYLCQLMGIVCVISLAKVIKTNRYISYVGQNTLICFALHGKCYSLIQTILKRLASGVYAMILFNVALSSLFAIAFSLLLSVILIIPAYIINRCFPFLLGRKSRQRDMRRAAHD